MKNFKILLVVSMASLTAGPIFAQTWTQTSAPTTHQWQCVASSADGSKLVAAGMLFTYSQGTVYSLIYTSTNSGATWASNNIAILFQPWTSVASSADGTRLVVAGLIAGSQNGAIFTSTNAGATWMSTSATNVAWMTVASSADGSKLVAAGGTTDFEGGGFISPICISTNGGATWSQTSAPSNYWTSIASSADGTKLVAATKRDTAYNPGSVYVSTNSGDTWTQTSAPSNYWCSVASSADGSQLAAAGQGTIYTSSDSGATWTSNNVPSRVWETIASSADGRILVAGINSGQIYSSTNSGATWTTNNAPNNAVWISFVSSADGSKLAGVALNIGLDGFPNGVYTSQTTPAPQLNLMPSASNLTVSWIVPSTDFALQQSADLTSWTDVTNPPALNLTNLQNEVVLSPTNGSGFYRLKTP
jgi:hypothetical protein